MNTLEKLKQYTKVVADTGDFESIEQFKPLDATTNPSLIFQAAGKAAYEKLLLRAVADAKKRSSSSELLEECIDSLAVYFGCEILKIVPGRVSTEVDARLSFDTEGTIKKARKLIGLYESFGYSRDRILIKIAATWEGIRAAEVLEHEGIRTNLTLLFSKIQAIACAEAGVQLISPFVGRILDWHLSALKLSSIDAAEDPGVKSVSEIFYYYKKFGYKTEIMGASFRNIGEIIHLAGCDLLTISPALLHELETSDLDIERKLNEKDAAYNPQNQVHADENTFRWMLNEDAMATEKLAEGIRKFASDIRKLELLITSKYL
jgi:transaldolase